MNIRIKFKKYGVMKFIGHLDMMRYFQKAIRRADIDIVYSEGYSPHQVMSFAAPLGVGITSDGEYFDIEVNSTQSSQSSIDALNRVMVEGITILEYKRLPDTAKTSMSLVAAADYRVEVKPGYPSFASSGVEFRKMVQEFFQGQSQICITKQTKKREIEMDLKPLIYEMKVLEGHNSELALFLKVCTGSSDNIKPELVLEAFCQFHRLPFQPQGFQIHRMEVYAKSEEIPVKGEKERQEYQKYLNQQKRNYQREGKTFPSFFTLGELGETIDEPF